MISKWELVRVCCLCVMCKFLSFLWPFRVINARRSCHRWS